MLHRAIISDPLHDATTYGTGVYRLECVSVSENFRTLQEMGVDDWIERNRLTIGLSESYRRVDHVAASLMRSQCQLNALQQTVVDIQSANAESARQHAESARQHTEVARQHARTATTVTELSGYNINS